MRVSPVWFTNIAWIRFHVADHAAPPKWSGQLGFTNSPDALNTQLLWADGHIVTRVASFHNAAVDSVGFFNQCDLVIISRSAPSICYETASENAAWCGLRVPVMVLGG
ncbi:MAG: hypothetical protein RMN51_08285 [Verrucomicrobiota bacterium]|nr:hypothetical protein [Limisphaera sp.]MDW8382086.1 hypothetical protein [Verrucomicrobiota bacterium]